MTDLYEGMDLPLIAILRGIEPDEAGDIGRALVTAGFRMIEVPMNSPDAIDSIERLVNSLGSEALIGAGTVRTVDQVEALAEVGGGLVVMPHVDTRVIATAKSENMICVPGVATITEAFDALDAGADALKVFPAEVLGPATVHAWRAVLPPEVILLPVGGIDADSMADFLDSGADGFGIGSAVYAVGDTAEEVAANAGDFIEAWDALANEDFDEDDDTDAEEESEADVAADSEDSDDNDSSSKSTA